MNKLNLMMLTSLIFTTLPMEERRRDDQKTQAPTSQHMQLQIEDSPSSDELYDAVNDGCDRVCAGVVALGCTTVSAGWLAILAIPMAMRLGAPHLTTADYVQAAAIYLGPPACGLGMAAWCAKIALFGTNKHHEKEKDE